MDKNARIERAEQLVAQIEDLPTIPAVANQVLLLLDQPDVEIEQVADLMLSDQVMTARVMKMLNSPVYRPTHEIRSFKRALVYLGLRHIREVALTTSFIGAFERDIGAFELNAFWEHSFGVGMVSKIIAEKVGYPDLEKAYISGIIHNFGMVVLNVCLPEEYQAVLAAIKDRPVTLASAEFERFGTSHSEIGLCMARKWNFPDVYCEVIACHHTPAEAVIDPVLCAIVCISDLFCSVRGLDYGGREWVSFNLSEEEAWEILKTASPSLVEMDVERFCYELDDAIPAVKELVNSIFSTKE
ncbi:HDOD domain-containing protein [Pelobacter propionicus]|uniref:Metal dependent phosphohydrolase n=1 Tax=Pelobacter propionicus (strain DSM 2379 / NBRC 103807 / OttBd1) TaxID=338966 RepID=A1AMD8_PELPD|nr:HDOD domain-containing protein [Pelobacter propionicus]ABK98508.1 metal dependent phosphohydrolase [Pelobacter propionicus DSM 2379]